MTDREETQAPLEQDDAIIGVAFKRSLIVIVVIAVVVVAVLFYPRNGEKNSGVIERPPIVAPATLNQSAPERPDVTFTDVTTESGIAFSYHNGATGERLLPETMGGGAAFFDFEGDGDQDLLLMNATDWPGDDPTVPSPTPALYRNNGQGHFEDVTTGSGLDVPLYGMGVACADFDGDAQTDVYLTALGSNRLFRNVGGGKFEDVTDRAGVAGAEDAWSTSAGFLDFDNDNDLDLFVCNYIRWSREIDLQLNFTLNGRDRAYGPPTQYEGAQCVLYRNEGDGTFTDVSKAAGVEVSNPATGKPMGKALAVVFVDVDHDGWQDIVVANDTVQNFLFHNRGDGTFEEIGASSAVAFDSMGAATGAMGIDAACVFPDDRLAIAIGNFANEPTSFYVQQPNNPKQFADMAGAMGIGSPSRLKLKFGLFFFDYDLDGRLDMLEANGHIEDEINSVQSSQTYRQSAQVFWNTGKDTSDCFVEVPPDSLGDLTRPIVGRGAVYADIDGDGDLDVLLAQASGAPLLARNDRPAGHHWVRLQLVGRTGNVDAIGARVELVAGGRTQRQQVMPTRSYLSQVETVLTFGLGSNAAVESVRITWPDGSTQSIDSISIDTLTVVRQVEAP